MADKTNLDGRRLKAALDELAEVGLPQTKNSLEETSTKKRKLVHVGMYSSPQCFFCPSRCCVDPEDNKGETTGHRSSRIKVRCDTSNNFLVEPCSVTIAYVDSDIAGKRLGENITQRFSWHWPGDDESILPIVTSIVDATMSLVLNAAIASLPDPSRKIRELSGSLEEPIRDGGLYACNVTPIFDNNTAA